VELNYYCLMACLVVLVVEARLMNLIMTYYLAKWGFEMEALKAVAFGLAVLKKSSFDVVNLEVRLSVQGELMNVVAVVIVVLSFGID